MGWVMQSDNKELCFFVRLNEVEKKLLEQRSNDMTEWKEVSSPVKEWISKHDKKIQAHGLIKTDHDAVVKQREDIEVYERECYQLNSTKRCRFFPGLPGFA